MPVAIASDTTNYLPRSLIDGREIHEVSLYVTLDGEQQREADILEATDAFYDRLRATEDAATTSQPAVGDFIAVWKPLLDEGNDVVSVHISSGISGTYESALSARDLLVSDHGVDENRMAIIDSRRACGGLGAMLLAGAREAAAGGDLRAVSDRIAQARDALKMWFAVDTLEYLRRGGRIGGAQAWLGSALKIKPILTLDGEITPIERVRTHQRAVARMIEFFHELHESGRDAWVVQHIQAADVAEQLVEEGLKIFGRDPLFVSEVGPVIGAHVGPGLLGVGAIPSEFV